MADEKFVDATMVASEPPCRTCRHRNPNNGRFCTAFPRGIPMVILRGEHNHRRPVDGDHGIRYSPVEEAGIG